MSYLTLFTSSRSLLALFNSLTGGEPLNSVKFGSKKLVTLLHRVVHSIFQCTELFRHE